jgi:hypothetical protein
MIPSSRRSEELETSGDRVPPTFFVSYARADVEHAPYHVELKRFIDDLSAAVAVKLTRPKDGIGFFDESSIPTGAVWTDALAEALASSAVGVALYTPNYFTRTWCGKEFEAFRKRRQRQPGTSGIVPILWIKCTTIPNAVGEFQYKDGTFPPEYSEVGMQRLLRLGGYKDQYVLSVEAAAERIATAADPQNALRHVAAFSFDDLPSAWDESVKANPVSHKEGGMSKTCFVYVSREGWAWKPYSQMTRRLGALAQAVSGELDVQYEEIPCDEDLTNKLQETNASKVPTVIFCDPAALEQQDVYARQMNKYDVQYLLNCAALIPWDDQARAAGETDPRWVHLKEKVCPQKTEMPPPFHEWRSIFTVPDLELKTRVTIEHLRSRLLNSAIAESATGTGGTVRKAEDSMLSSGAAAVGIQTDSLGTIEAPQQ